jgi:hypothetical protein
MGWPDDVSLSDPAVAHVRRSRVASFFDQQGQGDWTMIKDQIDDRDPIKIDDDDCIVDDDRALTPIGRFFRHNAMHAGTIPIMGDEFGRCARCVKLGFWKRDA